MSRSEEFAAGSNRFHPNVQDVVTDAPGGVGAVGGSVVGMVPTSTLARLRHHDGDVNPDSAETIARLRQDMRSGHGVERPLEIDYDHKSGWAYLGEGNHRLRAAEMEGVAELPVTVRRAAGAGMEREISGRGAPATHRPAAEMPGGHVPSAIHPSFLQFRESHETRDTTTEILDMLR